MKLEFDKVFFGAMMFSLTILSIALLIAVIAMVLETVK